MPKFGQYKDESSGVLFSCVENKSRLIFHVFKMLFFLFVFFIFWRLFPRVPREIIDRHGEWSQKEV